MFAVSAGVLLPPTPAKQPKELVTHNDIRIDDYYWWAVVQLLCLVCIRDLHCWCPALHMLGSCGLLLHGSVRLVSLAVIWCCSRRDLNWSCSNLAVSTSSPCLWWCTICRPCACVRASCRR
jgi:hypothetical protein